MLGYSLLLIGCTEVVPAAVQAAPSVLIQAPESAARFTQGESISFEGLIIDDQPSLEIDIIWNSDKDGVLFEEHPTQDGISSFATDALSINTHIITLNASDGNSSESDWIELRIVE